MLAAGLLSAVHAAADVPAGLCATTTATAAAADAAAQSLAARVEDDGRFRYRISAAGRIHAGYNIVRHAGSVWALAAYRQTFSAAAPEIDAAADRASAYLADCCLRAPPDAPDELAVWSVPEGQPLEAKLGAAGLALAGWSARRRAGQPAPPLDELRALARFIVRLQDRDGRFASKFIHDQPDDSGWVSLYYPGEAALGLLTLARIDPDSGWQRAAGRALAALADTRIAHGDWPPDHWALIATAVLLKDYPVDDPAPLRRQVREIAERLLAAQREDGAFDTERRTAPAATRLEALIAADAVLGDDDPAARARLQAAVVRGAAFLRGAQRQAAPDRGALTRAAPGSTAARAGERRIDDTQHALSVWLGLSAIQKETCKRV